jgi:hypothetical protein
MKTRIAACICIALTHQCLSDETLFTCKGGTLHNYTADGGHEKPGWSAPETKNVTKLIRTDAYLAKTGSFFNIEVTTQYGKVSLLEVPCVIRDILDPVVTDLDQAFVVTCKEYISTYLFYTRSGVPQLLETHLSLRHASTGASVAATKDCKQGD